MRLDFLIIELKIKTVIKLIFKANLYPHNALKGIIFITENNKAYVLTP